MDPKSEEHLEKILKKGPQELTDNEISFLKARRSYLKPIQLDEYESVLNQTPKGTVKKHAKNKK